MNPNVIQFACGHCQSWLTVPAHMAGVAGPCPRCGQHIVSPQQTAAPQPVAVQMPAPQAPSTWPPADLVAPQAPVHTSQATWPGAPGHLPAAQAPHHELYPPAPAAPPMVPPPASPAPWGQAPAAPMPVQGMPDPGASLMGGGYPLQNQGLRPNAGLPLPGAARGGALPPPAAPVNPVVGLLGPMPGGIPQPQYDPHGGGGNNTGMLSRPATVGGSRLSLLARQLTTPADGSPGLPVAPAPLSHADLPGQARPTFEAPDGSRNQQAGAMMLQQNMRRGLQVSRSRSRGGSKFALVSLLILSLVGALVWQYRAAIKDVVAQVFPPKVQVPEVVTPAPLPVPGVDKVTVAEPPPEPPSPSPASGDDVRPPSPMPSAGAEPQIATVHPPRAIPVEDSPSASGTHPGNGAAVDEGTPVNPLMKPGSPMTEVGTKTSLLLASRSAPERAPPPTPALGTGQPQISDLPPACKPALDGLMSFLNAHSWQERLKYTQLPDLMEAKLKVYYTGNQDGPVDVDSIEYVRHDSDPQVGKGMHVVFSLFSRNWGYGIPVMVEVTPDGARVDWLAFIEFKDDMLTKFLSNYMEGPVQFHVRINRTHYFGDGIPALEQKEGFSVTSPMERMRGFVFVPKGTAFARSLDNTISWDKEASYVVVQLQWRKEGNAQWVEMTDLPQLNWYSSAAPPPASERPPPAPKGSKVR